MHAKILALGLAVPMTMGAMAPSQADDAVPAPVAEAVPSPEPSVEPAAAPAPKKAERSIRASRSTRAAGVVAMRAKGTVFSPVKAANRLERWASRGVGGYHNQCLRLADNAYQPKGGRTGTALQQWHRARRNGFAHPRDRKPPIGAQMFWRTSHPAGHIATYVGNGKAVTNVPGGRVKKIDWQRMNNWGPYLGWAEPYYG